MPFRSQRGCPSCGSQFAICRTKGYSYERCSQCQGIWIESSVVQLMAHSILPGTSLQFEAAKISQRARPCPDCREPMSHVLLLNIPVDHCGVSEHGVWFDKDELRQVLEHVVEPEPDAPEPPTSFTSLLGDFFNA